MSLVTATRSEVKKQFTTAGWWVIALIVIAYVGLLAFGMAAALSQATSSGLPEDTVAPVIYSLAGTIGYALPLLFGTLMATSEFRHKLLVPTFLATPKRGLVLTAKLLVGVLMGVIFGIAGVVASYGAGAGGLALFGIDTQFGATETWLIAARIVLDFVLWTLVGIGIGSVVTNQIAAIVIVLAFTQFVEPMVRVAAGFVEQLEPIVRYLPGAASDALLGHSLLTLGSAQPADAGLSWWAGALVLAGYALVLTVIGAVTSWRRDVS